MVLALISSTALAQNSPSTCENFLLAGSLSSVSDTLRVGDQAALRLLPLRTYLAQNGPLGASAVKQDLENYFKKMGIEFEVQWAPLDEFKKIFYFDFVLLSSAQNLAKTVAFLDDKFKNSNWIWLKSKKSSDQIAGDLARIGIAEIAGGRYLVPWRANIIAFMKATHKAQDSDFREFESFPELIADIENGSVDLESVWKVA